MHVVILGGGLAGLTILTSLSKQHHERNYPLRITLVEPKTYFEIRWAAIRSMFDPTTAHSSTIPLEKILSSHSMVTHVPSRATNLTKQHVELEDGTLLGYDVCLIAIGCKPKESILTANKDSECKDINLRRKKLLEHGKILLNSKNLLICGGGPIGIEVAGDIGYYSKHQRSTTSSSSSSNNEKKLITLVHSGSSLIPSLNNGNNHYTENLLVSKFKDFNVQIITGNKVCKNQDSNTFSMDKNDYKIEPDITFNATGVLPSTPDLISSNIQCIREGWIRIDQFGRVVGFHQKVFAMGDCCDIEPKTSNFILSNKKTLLHNIKYTLNCLYHHASIDSSKLRTTTIPSYNSNNTAVVTTGPQSGIAYTPFGCTTIFFPWLKNKTMFLFRVKGEIGL